MELMLRAALLRAATELRWSRCCNGVAGATELRRPAPSRSFCASRGADAYATELMLRAALHCDGAATELRRSRCCDGVTVATELRRPAPSRSFSAWRLDALNEEPASFSLVVIFRFKFRYIEMSPDTTATFCGHLMGVFVLGWLYPVEYPRIIAMIMVGFLPP